MRLSKEFYSEVRRQLKMDPRLFDRGDADDLANIYGVKSSFIFRSRIENAGAYKRDQRDRKALERLQALSAPVLQEVALKERLIPDIAKSHKITSNKLYALCRKWDVPHLTIEEVRAIEVVTRDVLIRDTPPSKPITDQVVTDLMMNWSRA